MKIRCHNCYRVLNSNEEYCTKCGEHSEEISKIIKNGETLIDEGAQFKMHLTFYLAFAFLLNGALFVLYGVLFDKVKPGEYGEIGEAMPKDITYFSTINALLVTSIIMAVIVIFLNYKNFFVDYKITNKKRAIISSFAMVVIIGIFIYITKNTLITIVPIYVKDYLLGSIQDADLFSNSIELWKIVVILVLYGIVQEYIFRKHLAAALDEGTLMSLSSTIIVMTIIGVVLDLVCFSLFSGEGFRNILWSLLGTTLLQLVLTINYFYNKQSLLINLIARIVIVIGIVLFLS